MKKLVKILILVFIVMQGTMSTFAIDDSKVVSDSQMQQKELKESFDSVNQYTNSFFTPKTYMTPSEITEATKIKNKFYSEGPLIPRFKTLTPVKRLRLQHYAKMHPEEVKKTEINTKEEQEQPVKPTETIVLNCDFMEYFAERTELEATGNVVVNFPQNNSTLKADKLIYNQTSNEIKAIDNVVVISGDQEMKGEYLLIDMNEENSFMTKPITDFRQIHCVAKKGFMYGDKMIQEQGGMYITDHFKVDLKSDMFGPDLDRMVVKPEDQSHWIDEHGSKLKIATRELVINSKKEHDTVQLKHATILFNDKKVGMIPGITFHTNKNHDFYEGNFPELGTLTNMGLFVGPGFVLDTPHGSTLKLIPIFNYQSGAEDTSHMFGFGGIAKFKSATNASEFGYGTTNKTFLMKGIQYLDDNLYFQYGANRYIEDWFMGSRMTRLMGELVYQEAFDYNDFLAKDRMLTFTHRIAAGYMQDGYCGLDAPRLGEDGVGTFRGKYMAEIAQNLYKFNDESKDVINARLDLVAQANTAIYGTGDLQLVGRIGPRIHTQYKRWMQDAGYFFSAYSDHTPLVQYDKYTYGHSNVYLRESVRLCKYLTLSWFGSMNLSGDAPDGNLFQENGFYLAIGPDDIKLNIGYDIVRQQSYITMAMHLDAKGASLAYDKMVIKNPDTLGKTKEENYYDPNESKNKITLPEGSVKKEEHAEVIDIVGDNI